MSYAYPSQIQRSRRVSRKQLRPLPVRYRLARVAVRVPRTLPLVKNSYVSLDRYGRLTRHSRRQLVAAMATENNRRRYLEGKRRHRRANHGQLDSPLRDRLGIVAEAHRRGMSIEAIADAALVARGYEQGAR